MVFGGIYLGCLLGYWMVTGEVAGGGYVNESNWQSVRILQIVSLAVALIGLTVSISGVIKLRLVRYSKIPL